MKNNAISNTNTTTYFTVSEDHVNHENKALLPFVLYDKMESTAIQSIIAYKNILNTQHRTFKLNVLKNAYLDDALVIKNQIQKLNSKEIQLVITVVKKETHQEEIICKATFGYSLKGNTNLHQAS